MTKRVTDRQMAVVDCIHRYTEEKGYGPTVREIGEMLELSSPSTVHVHLKSLEKKGMIKRDPLKSRSIILTELAEEKLGIEKPVAALQFTVTSSLDRVIEVPLVGDVAAGEPILAEQNIVASFPLPVDLVGDSAGFMLKVHGESMVEAGINSGDYVVVRQQPVADNGDIVVAIVDDGATVKRFFKETDHIRLQPENSSMEPIILDDCMVAGKVVAVMRRL
ncbi:MAG: transcriptional repressor LexA [Eggerthellaceae bacterium]|nr:transcriptional repressor LexA [Eggerthellaceae bacterium]